MIAFRVLNLGRNCKNSCRVYTYCFVNNTETYMYFNCFHVPLSYAVYTQWPECQVVFFNFDLLHSVRGSWPDSRETSFDRFCLLCWSCWLVAAPSKKVVKKKRGSLLDWKRELEKNQTIFEICVLNPFRGQKIKENFFWTGSREACS